MKRIFLLIAALSLSGIILAGNSAVFAADSSGSLQSGDIEKIIKAHVIENTPWTEEQVTVKNVNVANKITMPSDGRYHLKPASGASMTGRTSFMLEITGTDNEFQSSWVTAEIGVWVDVVLASKPLKEKQVLNDGDFYIGRRELSRLPGGYLDDMREVSGKRVKRFVAANSILTENVLEEPPLFKRGDKVFIIAESDMLRVTAMGIAGEDGFRGRPVRITNMQSRKEVIGEVVADGTVSVRW